MQNFQDYQMSFWHTECNNSLSIPLFPCSEEISSEKHARKIKTYIITNRIIRRESVGKTKSVISCKTENIAEKVKREKKRGKEKKERKLSKGRGHYAEFEPLEFVSYLWRHPIVAYTMACKHSDSQVPCLCWLLYYNIPVSDFILKLSMIKYLLVFLVWRVCKVGSTIPISYRLI